ncbi:MAG: hypothetical protein U0133_17480 [Gemmatimonadales bacterium]
MAIDVWLKRLWLVIGAVVLPLVLLLAGVLLWSWYEDRHNGGEPAVLVPPRHPAATPDSILALRYESPEHIQGSSTRLVRVYLGTGQHQSEALFASSDAYGPRDLGPPVNIVFLRNGDEEAAPLLEQPGLITESSIPSTESDSLQTWLTFTVIRADTDHDGRLTASDDPDFVVTDLDGRNARHPLAAPLRFHSAAPGPRHNTLLIYALEPVGSARERMEERDMRQRAMLYDLATGTLAPYTALEAAVTKAERALHR